MTPVDPGGKNSFDSSQKIQVRRFTTRPQAKAWIFLYSRDNDKGLWYLPGSGLGPLSEGGRQLDEGSDRWAVIRAA